ncbi:hypothetical protein [Pseudotabrizicola sp. 4114]|uniref:hypothetical protein n=1 Tax=Pseudotabrizicola sp. 4114 TaxID=2817731 RepID=UPI00285811E4|nr:hypothetical protein [Pseudorhodobacter sp. 4114]
MLDRAPFWSPPHPVGTTLRGDGIAVTLLPTVPQIMASGDIAAALGHFGVREAAGLLGLADGESYTLRLARNRILIAGRDLPHAGQGWQDGFALSPMSGALAVICIDGPRHMELFARGSAVDPKIQSPCAALSFAGVTCAICRHGDGLRLHIDRGLATYFLDWAKATPLFPQLDPGFPETTPGYKRTSSLV